MTAAAAATSSTNPGAPGERPHYGNAPGQFASSTSSMSLNRLRKGSLDRPQHPYSPPHQQLAYDQQQSTGQLPYHTMSQADHRDSASEAAWSTGGEGQERYATPHSHRQNSVDSLSFANLNLNEQRQRRPSQPIHPSSISDYTYPVRPDSRAQSHTSGGSPHPSTTARTPSRNMARMATLPSASSAEPQHLTYGDGPAPQNPYAGTDHDPYTQSSSAYGEAYGDFDPAMYADSNGLANNVSSSQYQAYQAQYSHAAPSGNYPDYSDPSFYPQQQLPPGGSVADPNETSAFYDQNTGQYYSYNVQTQQYDIAGPSQYPAPGQSAPSNNGWYSDPYGAANSGYSAPPAVQQQGQSFDYSAGGRPLEPQHRAVSGASNHSYSNSGGGGSSSSAAYHQQPLSRNRTTASAKTTASSSSREQGPTISKQAVDDYRNRIKSDPDPETQFNFARFLIEAARRLAVATQQGSVDDAKSIKKYRDSLLQEAVKLIKRLATQGSGLGKPAYADAQFFLANCLGHGALGLAVDHEKAYNLYVQASKQNHPAATYRTAVCNEVGAGTRRDPNRAVLFYRKASALGDTAGMYKLGMILLNGLLGQPKNPREAVMWLKKAAAQADEENPHALHELGCLYEKQTEYLQNGQPVPSPVVRDEAQAREYFTQAAQLGHAPSQYRLGSCYEYGSLTCPVDPRRSIAWYTRAAEKGHAESELALSGWYLTGSQDVLKQSDSEAYLWARRAANKGLSKAEYAVGYYSEVGIGVKADIDEAKMWYLRAAASGNRRAMQRLSELKKLGNKKGQQARPTRQQAQSECIIS